jgi:hypothetical protein
MPGKPPGIFLRLFFHILTNCFFIISVPVAQYFNAIL